jgi:hypothetical protein
MYYFSEFTQVSYKVDSISLSFPIKEQKDRQFKWLEQGPTAKTKEI